MSSAISAFTIDQAARLTDLSEEQLRRWDTTGLFSPSFALENRRRPFSRIYSFQDLIGLRALAQLCDSGISVQKLRKARDYLRSLAEEETWAGRRFWVDRATGDLFFNVSEPAVLVNQVGQRVMAECIELEPIAEDVKNRIDRMRERTDVQIGRIVKHRYIQNGRPVFDGTRIPVETVVDALNDGCSAEDIFADFPRLQPGDVDAAVRFAETHGLLLAS